MDKCYINPINVAIFKVQKTSPNSYIIYEPLPSTQLFIMVSLEPLPKDLIHMPTNKKRLVCNNPVPTTN